MAAPTQDSDDDSDDHSLDDAEDGIDEADNAEQESSCSKVDDESSGNQMADLMDDTPVLVQRGLYIGTYRAEQNKQKLLKTRITDVLQVAEGLFPHFPLQFNYMNIQVQDRPSEDMVVHFNKCFEFIDNAIARGGSVLVHCAAGVSRSATVVLGYLMARGGMSFHAAGAHLRTIRPWVQPNCGFTKQLETFEIIGCDLSKWVAWQQVWKEEAGAANGWVHPGPVGGIPGRNNRPAVAAGAAATAGPGEVGDGPSSSGGSGSGGPQLGAAGRVDSSSYQPGCTMTSQQVAGQQQQQQQSRVTFTDHVHFQEQQQQQEPARVARVLSHLTYQDQPQQQQQQQGNRVTFVDSQQQEQQRLSLEHGQQQQRQSLDNPQQQQQQQQQAQLAADLQQQRLSFDEGQGPGYLESRLQQLAAGGPTEQRQQQQRRGPSRVFSGLGSVGGRGPVLGRSGPSDDLL